MRRRSSKGPTIFASMNFSTTPERRLDMFVICCFVVIFELLLKRVENVFFLIIFVNSSFFTHTINVLMIHCINCLYICFILLLMDVAKCDETVRIKY